MQIPEEYEQITNQAFPPKKMSLPPARPIALLKSYSEDALDNVAALCDGDTMEPSNANKPKEYLAVSRQKTYHSDTEIDSEYSVLSEEEENDNYHRNKNENNDKKKNRKTMSMTMSKSFVNNINSRYGKRKKKIKIKVEHLQHLSRDDLKYELIKEKKKRIGDKRKFQRESRILHDRFTSIADKYEDHIKENENEMKQEYEAKLIEAEIKKKELEQEVQRLKTQLQQQHSIKSAATDDSVNNATLGAVSTSSPRPGAITITAPQMYNNDNPSNHITPITAIPGTYPPTNNTQQADIQQYETPVFSQFGITTPPPMIAHPYTLTTLERKEVSDEVNYTYLGANIAIETRVTTVNSMDEKLKKTMSPHIHHSTFADITQFVTFPETGTRIQQEGSDEDMEKGIVVLDPYSRYNVNDNNDRMENNVNRIELEEDSTDSSDDSRSSSGCSITPSPEPPPKRKKKNKEKIKEKEEKG